MDATLKVILGALVCGIIMATFAKYLLPWLVKKSQPQEIKKK